MPATSAAGYWLYVVFDCATPRPRLVRVQDPFGKLLARGTGVARLQYISVGTHRGRGKVGKYIKWEQYT